MRPHEPKADAHSGNRPRPNARTVLALLFLSAAPASAHNVLVSRGRAIVHPDHVEVSLDVAAEDLLHWYDLRPGTAGTIDRTALLRAVDEFAVCLGDVLVVRDAAGERLPVECRPPEANWPLDDDISFPTLARLSAIYRWKFSFSHQPEVLIFQLRPEALPVEMPWHIVLSAQVPLESDPPALRLTSGGNAEILDLARTDYRATILSVPKPGQPSHCAPCNQSGARRFREVCVELAIEDRTVNASIYVPLSLLNTWITLSTDDEGFLNVREQARAAAAARDLMQSALGVETNAGAMAAGLGAVEITPIVPPAAGSEPRPVSLWAGQMRVGLAFTSSDRIEAAEMTWNLFNAAVLSAHAILRFDGRCLDHEFSTYDATLEWRR